MGPSLLFPCHFEPVVGLVSEDRPQRFRLHISQVLHPHIFGEGKDAAFRLTELICHLVHLADNAIYGLIGQFIGMWAIEISMAGLAGAKFFLFPTKHLLLLPPPFPVPALPN